ncbi:hypothetical protein B7494_g100 [Chlorociboria aeruginascens]|nr:hypothetical protein B7494_g100 [Chlorociboria aeruginascens]
MSLHISRDSPVLGSFEERSSCGLEITYPEGGLAAWTVAIGSWCAMTAALGLVNSLGVFQAYVSTILLPSSSANAIGWIFGLYVFVSYFCGLLIGPIFDARGPRVLLVAGTICTLVGIFTLSVCTEYYQFILALSILAGVGSSLLFTPAMGAISHWFHARRGTASGFAFTGSGLGGVIFPLMMQSLLPQVGWAWSARIVGFVLLSLCIVSMALCRSRLPPRKGIATSWRDMLPDPNIFWDGTGAMAVTTAGVFFVEWAYYVPITYVPSYYLVRQGLSNGEAVNGNAAFAYQLLAILNGASCFGRYLTGYIADKSSESRLYTFSQESKDHLRKFRLGTSRANDPQAVIYLIDKNTLEIKQDDEKTVYTNLQEIGDDLPDHSPRFVLLSYPLTLIRNPLLKDPSLLYNLTRTAFPLCRPPVIRSLVSGDVKGHVGIATYYEIDFYGAQVYFERGEDGCYEAGNRYLHEDCGNYDVMRTSDHEDNDDGEHYGYYEIDGDDNTYDLFFRSNHCMMVAQGIGLGITAALLMRENTNVIATVRDMSSKRDVLEGLPCGNGSTLYILEASFPLSASASLTLRSSLHALGVKVINTIIASAGGGSSFQSSIDTTLASLREAFEINTLGPISLYQCLEPLLLKGGNGKLVLISSSLGSIGGIERAVPCLAYGVSKAGANFFVHKVHFEEEGVVAMAVHPGWVKTESGQSFADAMGVNEPPMNMEDSVRGVLEQVCDSAPNVL